MKFNFKTVSDEQQWVIDTEDGTWARASSIISASSIVAAEHNAAHFVPQEEGHLIPMGGGRYAFEGRKPFDEQGKPQLAVVCILTLLSSDDGGTCVTLIQGNVALKELQHQTISKFHAECLPPLQLTKASAPKTPRFIPVEQNPPQIGEKNVQS
jgi:hypothetical protein